CRSVGSSTRVPSSSPSTRAVVYETHDSGIITTATRNYSRRLGKPLPLPRLGPVEQVLLQLQEFQVPLVLVEHVIDDLVLRVAHDVVPLRRSDVEVDLHSHELLVRAGRAAPEGGHGGLHTVDEVVEGACGIGI